MQNSATISLGLHSQMIFIRNHAQHYGGALYVKNMKVKINYFKPMFFPRKTYHFSKENIPSTSLPRIIFQEIVLEAVSMEDWWICVLN